MCRYDPGAYYTKNFTALDLDGDFLTWTVTVGYLDHHGVQVQFS